MRPLLNLWLVTGVAILLPACGGSEHADIKQWMAESSRDLRGSVPPLPELKPFPIVSYISMDKPDPFGAGRFEPDKSEAEGGKKPDFDRPAEPLEKFALESMSYVGLVSKDKDKIRHALILVNGAVFQVQKGNHIGQNFGRIVDITDSEIVLLETVRDPSGRSKDWVERKMTLQLLEGAKGKEAGK